MIPKRSWLNYCLLVGILLVLSIIFYWETISYFPSHIHAWTQSDRYAIALKFLENGFNLFKPQTFNLQTVEGVTAGDLPLPEWFVAIWMKILGSKAPGIFRYYTLFVAFIGYVFFFSTVKKVSQSTVKSILVVVFVFTCPVITYYQAGFLPSSTSLAIFFVGCFFCVLYWEKGLNRYFILAVGLLCLAALIRKSFVIFLFALFLYQLSLSLKNRFLNYFELIVFGIAFLIFIGLQVYNIHLSQVYGSIFLSELMPARSLKELEEILNHMYHAWRWQYFTVFHYVIFLLTLTTCGVCFLQKRKVELLIQHIFLYGLICLLGGFAYFFLMARQFVDHEYYLIDSLYIGLFLIFIAGLSYISFQKSMTSWIGDILMIILLIGAIVHSKSVQIKKYSVLDRGETTRINFTGSEEWLDQQNVPKNARMLVLDAYSTNVPLILMNRDGYTVLITRDSTIRSALEYDFDYVVIQDEFIPSEIVNPYPGIVHQLKRISGNGKISLFKREPTNAMGTLDALLGIKQENIRFSDTLDFSIDSLSDWEIPVQVHKIDSTQEGEGYIGMMNKEQVFGPTFIKKLPQPAFDRLLFGAGLEKLNQMCEGKVAVSIQNGDELVFYQDYQIELYHDGWQNVQFMFKLPAYIPENSVLKCYLWNPNKCDWHMDYLRITAFEN